MGLFGAENMHSWVNIERIAVSHHKSIADLIELVKSPYKPSIGINEGFGEFLM